MPHILLAETTNNATLWKLGVCKKMSVEPNKKKIPVFTVYIIIDDFGSPN